MQASGSYKKLLRRIHTHLQPRTYVEIGVAKGKTLRLALPGTKVVGIDPTPRIGVPVEGSLQLFEASSDDFFATHDLRRVLAGHDVDLAFIDGMHLFEHALRDFFHLEAFCQPESTILVHDCKPLDAATSSRVRGTSAAWTGDVWKLLLCLKEYRPDLRIATVDVRPTGLALIRQLDPTSTVLIDSYDEICERYIGLDYSVLAEDRDNQLNLVPDDWNLVRDLLT